MAILSGKAGTLQLDGERVAPIGHWKLQLVCQAKEYVANDTHGAKRRLAGADDAQGSFLCLALEDGHCPIRRGQRAVARLHVDASGANYYELPIQCERVEIECDIGRGRAVAFAVYFWGDGPTTAYGVLDTP